MLDALAKGAYRRRLAEVEQDIDEAQTLGDGERSAQAQVERDFLARERDHLDRTIRTGTTCGYLPDPRVAAVWQL